jgi:hypothetical protein
MKTKNIILVLMLFTFIMLNGSGCFGAKKSNTTTSPTASVNNSIGSISDNPGYKSATAIPPKCNIESWIEINIIPSINKIFEQSKFISAGSCNALPYSGGKIVTKKLLTSVAAASDAKDLYNDLNNNGFSPDNSPLDRGSGTITEMTIQGLYNNTPVIVLISFDLNLQVINISVKAE